MAMSERKPRVASRVESDEKPERKPRVAFQVEESDDAAIAEAMRRMQSISKSQILRASLRIGLVELLKDPTLILRVGELDARKLPKPRKRES